MGTRNNLLILLILVFTQPFAIKASIFTEVQDVVSCSYSDTINSKIYLSTISYEYGAVPHSKLLVLSNNHFIPILNEIHGKVNCILVQNSSLIIAGQFDYVDGENVHNIAIWDGLTWNDFSVGLGNENTSINGICLYNSKLILAGDNLSRFGNNLMIWNDSLWENFTSKLKGIVNTILVQDSSLFIGGEFYEVDSLEINNFAKFDHEIWTSASNGLVKGRVNKLIAYNGSIILTGLCSFIDTNTVKVSMYALKYMGGEIYELDSSLHSPPTSIAVLNNYLYLGSVFGEGNILVPLIKYDGSVLSNVELPVGIDSVKIIDTISAIDGELFLSGEFNSNERKVVSLTP